MQRLTSCLARRQSGFSLVELLLVMAVLMTVLAVVVSGVTQLQRRNTTETAKLDISQEAREFMDQIVRDLHQAGYPGTKVFDTASLIVPPANDRRVAVGLVSVAANQIQFEGDLDGSGVVQSVTLQLVATGPGGTCPCTLRRGSVNKVDGSSFTTPAGAQGVPVVFTEVNNLINSNNVFTISGNTQLGASNDVFYAACKSAPVFAAFDQNGTPVALPIDLNTVGPPNIRAIKTITVTVTVLSPTSDPQNKTAPVISMTADARVND